MNYPDNRHTSAISFIQKLLQLHYSLVGSEAVQIQLGI